MDLVIATKHWHKIREIRQILKPLSFLDVYSLHDFPDCKIEDVKTTSLKEKSASIASFCSQKLQKWVLSDCSRLVIPAIQSEFSSLSEDFFDSERNLPKIRKQILSEMRSIKEGDRSAYLECYMVLAGPEGIKKQVHSVCEGSITTEEIGNHGHSYDFLFVKNNYDKTLAQLGEEIKNKVSHRRKALDNILLTLETLS